eukprot:gb/GECG01007623.1/.p1 GENE.gb/GECG01007623.1/~~gb/GECG01007623.1/.p1  ORF type:complete len:845 (+),score=98.99 gb/GECG01007623.1/:1-2535(+)
MHWGIGLAMTAALVAIWVPFLKIFEQSNTGFREELWTLYENELKPIEEQCHYHDFVSPPLTKADIMYDVPMVLLTGLYSTGKTTFISHLLGEDYPQARVGPQPTTDKFVAVMKNETRGTIAGHAIINQNDLPFSSLDSLGGDFLDHFMGSFSPARLLDHVSFIDTPGVLSGKASMIQRGYDYPEVVRWFGERAGMIIVMFDVEKTDASEEFTLLMEALQGNTDKVYVVLNKADRVDEHDLRAIQSAVMKSLIRSGFDSAEPKQIFVGSFPKQNQDSTSDERRRFDGDAQAIWNGIQNVASRPQGVTLRNFRRRILSVKSHLLLLERLGREAMKRNSSWVYQYGLISPDKTEIKRDILNKLGNLIDQIQKEYDLSSKSMPLFPRYKDLLEKMDFTKLKRIAQPQTLIDQLDEILKAKLPRLFSESVSSKGPSNRIFSTAGESKEGDCTMEHTRSRTSVSATAATLSEAAPASGTPTTTGAQSDTTLNSTIERDLSAHVTQKLAEEVEDLPLSTSIDPEENLKFSRSYKGINEGSANPTTALNEVPSESGTSVATNYADVLEKQKNITAQVQQAAESGQPQVESRPSDGPDEALQYIWTSLNPLLEDNRGQRTTSLLVGGSRAQIEHFRTRLEGEYGIQGVDIDVLEQRRGTEYKTWVKNNVDTICHKGWSWSWGGLIGGCCEGRNLSQTRIVFVQLDKTLASERVQRLNLVHNLLDEDAATLDYLSGKPVSHCSRRLANTLVVVLVEVGGGDVREQFKSLIQERVPTRSPAVVTPAALAGRLQSAMLLRDTPPKYFQGSGSQRFGPVDVFKSEGQPIPCYACFALVVTSTFSPFIMAVFTKFYEE